ncbi:hypothetical protein FBD94_15395 [Pedobacter hiemivivus]|uniref:Uncharacterized protein n=1 Tax=Pedobacter hiemivivus TaxID=2530454 RepID=A0A4U1G9E6_9SPHI|nr:RHS repeat-associated core domain-containing protein [Pedobacter hiemivivus]TKC60288.1 hypothetical protein FBD94_15395 [Pedobacter hiemivivus]
MKHILLLFVLLGLGWNPAKAQSGTSMYDAFPIAINSCGNTTFTDYQNNYYFNDSFGNPNPEVWYSFNLLSATDVSISLCGSTFDTYLYVLDGNYNVIASSDDDWSMCGGVTSYIYTYFGAGTYYIVAEGSGYNTGDIALSFDISSTGGTPSEGANIGNAIHAGSFGSSGSYTDSRSNADGCLGNDIGQASNDIYYQFSLSGESEVTLSHCGSGFDTYMHLLDASGNEIAFNDDSPEGACPGVQSYIQTTLPAGTYYVVSEGYAGNVGNITTSINVVGSVAPPLPSLPVISYTSPSSLTVGSVVSLIPVNTGGAVSLGGQSTTTLAGAGYAGFTNGIGTGASFNNPLNTVVDASGNVFVSDVGNQSIRKITPSGVVTTFAGGGYAGYADGVGTSALFRHPSFMAVNSSGNIFVSDQQNHRIRKITPAGVVSTFAGSGSIGSANGTGTAASFQFPMGLAFDGSGNLYVSDAYNHKIRKISPLGVVSDFAGSGSAGAANGAPGSASFNLPMGLAFDVAGNLYVADRANDKIRKISSSGVVSTIAGNGSRGFANGSGASVMFWSPNNLVLDGDENIYVVDQGNNMIRKVSPGGEVTTFAGATIASSVNGTGGEVRFNSPFGISKGPDGTMYVAENAANLVRKMTLMTAYTISPSLPPGLSFNYTTGEISGTPSGVWPAATYTITAFNSAGSSSATLNFEVTLATSTDQLRNWILTKSYDEDGNLTGESKAFMDNNGKTLQTQVKSLSKGQVLASEQLYDALGRPAISTLVAPIDNTAFNYKDGFVQNTSDAKYSYNDFDLNNTDNPSQVGINNKGTLGWYYSNNNSTEPYVGATVYPYARSDYFKDGSGGLKRSAGVGEQLKMGAGHENRGVDIPVINELDFYKQVRDKFFSPGLIGESESLINKAIQSVVTDENGNQGISISDLSGNPLISARPGIGADWQLFVNNNVQLNNKVGYRFEINGGTYGTVKDISIRGEGFVSVYESHDGGLSYQLYYNGSAGDYPGSTGSWLYRIESPLVFEVSYNAVPSVGPEFRVCDRCQASVSSFGKKQVHYFQLLQNSTVTIVGDGLKLYNMDGDEQEISFTSGGTLSKGYYKAAISGNGDATLSYSNSYTDLSFNFYNHLGQLISSIAPEGVKKIVDLGIGSFNTLDDVPFVARNEYDLQGRLIATINTDAGRAEYIYRKDGNIRFSQNAEQRKTGKFSYTNYDQWGRSSESGEYFSGDITFTSAKTNEVLQESIALDGGLIGGARQSNIIVHYDYVNNDHGLPGYVQDEGFLGAGVSWTENARSKTWYNYDGEGRVKWLVKSIVGLGVKTIDYTYDAKGNVVKVDYQKNISSERFIHEYEYDGDNRLQVAYTSTDPLLGRKEQARYHYYLHGPLKRIELAENLQGVDYTYTSQGLLKAINHPDNAKDPGKDGVGNGFAPDAFGMTLEYFYGDYNRNNTGISSLNTGTNKTYFNGSVSGQSWRSLKPSAVVGVYGGGVNNPAMFTYEYDNRYQFNNNKYGSPDFNTNFFNETINVNREFNLGYDANGNINSLSRTDQSGNIKNNFSGSNFHYQLGTNKLTSVDSYGDYIYDDLGRMTGQVRTGGLGYYPVYDVSSRIVSIYSDASHTLLKVSFGYDEMGTRISKTDHVQNITTYYVTDAAGNVMAIYDNHGSALQQKELPLYTSSRIGVYSRSNDSYKYELTDHLGNVRVVINQSKTASGDADVLSYSDYYPFGSPLTLANNDYRYGYQGQFSEVDKETGWNNFDLRMYDPAIGRWMSTDPYGQFDSPYVGMGNNPISSVDPDGGYSLIGALWRHVASFVRGERPDEIYNNGNTWGFNTSDKDGSVRGHFSESKTSKIQGNLDRSIAMRSDWKMGRFNESTGRINSYSGRIETNTFFEEVLIGGAVFKGVGLLGGTAAEGGASAFRYMTEAELKAVQTTGLLRGGRAGETFFTKDLYKSAASAQNRLALPTAPTLRVEFQILNNPTLLSNGTKVLPANGMMGKGAEFMTLDAVKVKLINWQHLR